MAEKEIWKANDDSGPRSPDERAADNIPKGDATPLGSSDVQTITVANIIGPLVILYGPSDVGKTAALLRLCTYVAPGYTVEIDPNFRSDKEYALVVDEFERQRKKEVFAPSSTGAIDFLLANVSLRGTAYCQILEAPGEHFFPKSTNPEAQHPYYLQTIFQSPIRKVYALFFEVGLMNNDQRLRSYVTGILNVLRRHADANKDRIIIIFNKCDQRPDLTRNGRPLESQFRRLLYSNSAFTPLAEFLKANRFGRVNFVAFSSGQFGKDMRGRQTFAMSSDHYPQALWRAIHDCVKGRFRFWPW